MPFGTPAATSVPRRLREPSACCYDSTPLEVTMAALAPPIAWRAAAEPSSALLTV